MEQESVTYTIKFPCKKAMRIPMGEKRGQHIRDCKECQRIKQKLKELGVM